MNRASPINKQAKGSSWLAGILVFLFLANVYEMVERWESNMHPLSLLSPRWRGTMHWLELSPEALIVGTGLFLVWPA
jgi:hypothetical protein